MAKILIACIHYPVASGRFIARAFARLGHEVKTIGPYTGKSIWGIEVEEKYAWQPDWIIGEDGFIVGPESHSGWKPNLIITADSAWTFNNAPPPHVLWGVDNHVRDYNFGFEFDHYFLAHSWGTNMNRLNATWLPPGYDLEAHTDLDLERSVDVGFIGYPYQNRMDIIDSMRAAGINLQARIGLLWDEYNLAMNACRIALVQSIHGDLTTRFFENMAQGCCVLADKTVDAEKLGFKAGVDYWPFSGPADAVLQAKYLLDSGLWRQVAANGQALVAPHSWDARCQVVLDTMGIK